MDITVTHRPLTLEEAVPITECLRKFAGIQWSSWFYVGFCALILGALAWKSMSLELLIFVLAAFSVFCLPAIFSRRTRVSVNNKLLRLLAQSPLYALVHRIHLTDSGLHTEVPGFSVSCDWAGMQGFFHCASPTCNDELLLLLMPGYPILRKSDFESEADFYELLTLLQRQSLSQGGRQ